MTRQLDEIRNVQSALDRYWELRACWLSTLTYQQLDFGWVDLFQGPFRLRRTLAKRRRCDTDMRLSPVTNYAKVVNRNRKQKTVESNPPMAYYQSLPSQDSIRLLHLLPGTRDSPVETTLSVHSLTDSPPYEALSYTWGTSGGFPMTCDSCSTLIQESLFQAFNALRQRDEERILWVDAVCINQHDDRERSSQVQLMRRIYQNSTRLVVWLGEHDQGSKQGIDFLLSIRSLARKHGNETKAISQALAPDDLPKWGLPLADSSQWTALNAIFWRPWFTRIWIIQELAVSKDPIVVCGDSFFPWTEMAYAAQFALEHSLTAITSIDPRRPISLENFRQDYLTHKGESLMLSLLLKARDAFATDDRDKIFALMGLCGQDLSGFAPDYSLSIEEVFTRFSKYYIEKTGNLDILGAVEDHSYSLKEKLPSWVPDWEVHPPALALSSLDQYTGWSASRSSWTEASFGFGNKDKILVVKGISVDTILHVGFVFIEFSPLPGTIRLRSPTSTVQASGTWLRDFRARDRYRQWERIARKNKPGSPIEETLSTFIRTVTADAPLLDPHLNPADTEIASSSSNLDVYNVWRKYWHDASESQGIYISKSYAAVTPTERELAVRFMHAHHHAAYGRRFFTTKQHRYMGLGPEGLRKGDKLVVLFGGRTPFILRRVGEDRWKFKGECFVPGLMHGEALGQRGGGMGDEIRTEEYHIV